MLKSLSTPPPHNPTTTMPATAVSLVLLYSIVSCCHVAMAADGQTRPAANDQELRMWLENMIWHHRYSIEEVSLVTGLDDAQVVAKLKEFDISAATKPSRSDKQLLMLPYPGGRHPRIGFRDGAIEPQRETKLSVF